MLRSRRVATAFSNVVDMEYRLTRVLDCRCLAELAMGDDTARGAIQRAVLRTKT